MRTIQLYEIWSEGYVVQGARGKAFKIGEQVATSFYDACVLHPRVTLDTEDYQIENPRTWGCRLFDNEIDARKSFG